MKGKFQRSKREKKSDRGRKRPMIGDRETKREKKKGREREKEKD